MVAEILRDSPDTNPKGEGLGLVGLSEPAAFKNRLPHVVAILPRGEAIRNFVYSRALDEAAREVQVTLLSVNPNQEIRDLLDSRYRTFELREFPEKWIVNILRELIDGAHGRRLRSAAARERWRLRKIEATSPKRKLKRWTKNLTCYPFANSSGLRLLSKVERASSRVFRTTDEYVHFFKEQKPTLVFNGSHVHSRVAIQAVQAAQWLKIPTAAFIFSWDNLTSQGRIMPLYDFYLVWNSALRDQLLSIYQEIKPEQVFVTGTPQFDFHFNSEFYWTREQFCERVGADPSRPIVLYSTGMANHMPGEPQIVERIADMLREMTNLGPPTLLVRVYAKDQTGRFEQLKRSRPDILFSEPPWEPVWLTPKFEDCYVLTNTLRHADVGINVASTVTLELCMFDKPVINVAYNPTGVDTNSISYALYYNFDHYSPVAKSGAVGIARSESEMFGLLRDALSEPLSASAQRRALIREMFGNMLDGQASGRVAAQLIKLSAQTSSSPWLKL